MAHPAELQMSAINASGYRLYGLTTPYKSRTDPFANLNNYSVVSQIVNDF